MIFGGGLAAGKILITIIGVSSTILTAGYYMRFAWKVFFGSTPEKIDPEKAPLFLRAPLVILAATSIVLGVLPGLMLGFITPAAEYISGFIGS